MGEPGLADALGAMSPEAFAVAALVINIALVLFGAALGAAALRLPSVVRLTPDPGRPSPLELWLVVGATLVNTGVTVVLWHLWRTDVISLPGGVGAHVLLELLVLILVMDALTYAGHMVAHLRQLFPVAHRLHHSFSDSRPITLFALHPLEVVGFGALWVVVLAAYPFSVWTVGAYALLNLAFGIFGHLGVEPLPAKIRRSEVFRWVATPTLHIGHHADMRYNLGFYTTVWDRLFGTLEPGYDARRTAEVPPPYAVTVPA